MLTGSLRVQRAKMIREVMTELSSESFPPYEIMLSVAESLRSTRQTRGNKSSTDGLVVPIGKPRYVKGIFPTTHPKIVAMQLYVSS